MRLVLLFVAFLMAAPFAQARTPRDWTQVVSQTAEGGFLMGNPKARVLLVEYASFTCGHCAAFHQEAVPQLKAAYVAKGLVRFELRSLARDAADLAGAVLARCRTPALAFAFSGRLFASQEQWLKPFTQLTEADRATILAQPEDSQLLTYARLGKLDALAISEGFTTTQFEACMTDRSHEDALARVQQRAQADGVKVTPALLVNGALDDSIHDWPTLKTALDRALQGSPRRQ